MGRAVEGNDLYACQGLYLEQMEEFEGEKRLRKSGTSRATLREVLCEVWKLCEGCRILIFGFLQEHVENLVYNHMNDKMEVGEESTKEG